MIIDLNRKWQLHEAPITWGVNEASRVEQMSEGWLQTSLPSDVHMPLIAEGLIKDPVLADYCLDSEWIEKRSWWFRTNLDSSEIPDSCDKVELEIDSLDAEGDIWFNGVWLGHHRNAHYPFQANLRPYLNQGQNTILVRLTSGLEQVTDLDLAQINWAVCTETADGRGEHRGDMRRAFVRKPQYVYGWDWGPRIATIGIMKGARVKCSQRLAVRSIHLATVSVGNPAVIRATVDVENLLALQTIDADLDLEMRLDGQVVTQIRRDDVLLRSGMNHIGITLKVENPKLWWPNGMGAQPLYEVTVSAASKGFTDTLPVTRYGIRTIDLDLARIDPDNRRFQFIVNGQPVICKGGDWIPADAIYARVSPAKYDQLIKEAQDANFNMLRIWGGGIYETEAFYAACDRYGILIWHDFMFACSTYPDHLDWFRQEAAREMDYQTRRLRNHAAMALWCGNNENQWIFADQARWGIDIADSQTFGLHLYNQLAPAIVQQNCPEIPYWNSSPYGGAEPNACSVGDRHHWHDCMMNPVMEKRITPELYDGIGSKFVSEYGYPGPCVRKTIEEYLDGQPIDRDSKVWDMHNNTFEKHTVLAGIRKHYTDRTLDFDDYILYASLVQGLMLGYSLEALRATPECNGALFWMYNDCWGEVGWTIIDYYLRRKPSYYMVKRAFAPVHLILRMENEIVQMIGCNDTAEHQSIPVEAGWFPLDGSDAQTTRLVLELKPFSRGVVYSLPLPVGDIEHAVYAVKPAANNLNIQPAILRQTDHRNLKLVEKPLTLANVRMEKDDLLLTISSAVFAHAVHFQAMDLLCSDNYFDLLPGESREVRVFGGAALDPSLVKLIAVVP